MRAGLPGPNGVGQSIQLDFDNVEAVWPLTFGQPRRR